MLKYDRDTGEFIWRERPLKYCKNTHSCNLWNARYAGKQAGTVHHSQYEYRRVVVSVFKKRMMAHRLAWLYVYGEMPTAMLDHINGNPLDNRIDNLRKSDHVLNGLNNSRRASGELIGVKKVYNSWSARATQKGKEIYLGCSKDFFEAVCMRKSWEATNELYAASSREV